MDMVTHQRLVIAPLAARAIPRRALRIESLDETTFQVSNIHARLSYLIGDDGRTLSPGHTCVVADKIVITLPNDRRVQVGIGPDDEEECRGINSDEERLGDDHRRGLSELIGSSLLQFFSPEIARRIEADQDLLSARDANVTLLVCKIHGFRSASQRVGPKRMMQWINAVLTELSQIVIDSDGVLVDYVGHDLIAMWGAPAEQPEHAVKACRAACNILAQADSLRSRWQDLTPDEFGFDIGIHTGITRVGFIGSKFKFKYGPVGDTVEMANRLSDTAARLGVAALMTDSTARAVGREFDHRRLAIGNDPVDQQSSALRGSSVMHEPVTLHELKACGDDSWRQMSVRYESALDSFEKEDLASAARQLASIVQDHPHDRPSVTLLGRAVMALAGRE